jgi:hypothetical protein
MLDSEVWKLLENATWFEPTRRREMRPGKSAIFLLVQISEEARRQSETGLEDPSLALLIESDLGI